MIISAYIARHVGLFNYVSNDTLIRNINMPNVKESSKTKMLLEDIHSFDQPHLFRPTWENNVAAKYK